MSTLPLFDSQILFESKPPKLRPYQARAIQILRDRVRAGKLRILLVAPTGAGKMTIIAAIIRTSSVPVLFVCDRMELVEQCVEQLRLVGITNVGVIRGDDSRVNPDATVQVASIQTLSRRDKPPAGLVFVDEAHKAVSDGYKRLLDHYKRSIVLGFTATPTRYDSRPLGNLFECLEVVATYESLIKDGFVAAPICYSGPIEPDLSSVQMTGGDYNDGQLGDIMRDKSLVGQLLEHWKKLANLHSVGGDRLIEGAYRRTFIFAASIQHSLDICERFAAAGVRIAHLDGNTPEKERRAILAALASGELDAVTNVGVLLEGVDIPSAKCVVHARPTQSIVLWRQSAGRILRPWHQGCPLGCREHPSVVPILLDHSGNISRHGFPHEDLHWELTTKARSDSEKKPATRICPECYAYIPAYKQVCPYCGCQMPPPKERELPKESEEQLQRLVGSPEEMRRMYFQMISKVARIKGYKPGFAGARYKTRYGAWPPWEWSEELKASFASDPEWQANYQANQERKKKFELEKMAKELAKIEEPDE